MNTKKIPYFLCLLLIGVSLNAWSQHGIGTNTPNPNAVLELTSPDSDKGFLAPRVALTSSSTLFTGVTATASDTGLLVYNTSTTSSTASGLQGSGFYFWNGTYWERFTTSTENNLITSLDCHAATISGSVISGEAANLTVSLPYGGGVGINYAGGTTISSGIELGINGLTATLQAGTLAIGTGTLTYTITGTPLESGDAYFGVDFGGESCVLVVPVIDPSSGGTASVSNWDCSGTAAGSLYRGEEASGVSKIIYANVTNEGTYNVTANSNGITYTGMGTFTETGVQSVLLIAKGTPTESGLTTFTLSITPNCEFTHNVIDSSTGGTASVDAWNCAAGTSSGTLYRNENVIGVGIYKTILGNVTQLGTYNFTAAANGVTYTASGTFTTLGSQTVTLTATGTPADTGTHAYALSTTPSCTFDLTTLDRSSGGTAILAFNCAVMAETGTVTATEAVVGVTQEIQATVIKAGTYSMTTDQVNGLTFANSGSLTTGIQSITLTGTGTATTEGTYTYTLNTSPACTFDREAIIISLPVGMSITNLDQTHLVASLFDDNYLPFTSPTGAATTTAVSPDGTTETLVDIPGVIGILGSGDEITVSLSYTATMAVAYPAINLVVSVPSNYIEGGGGPIDLIFGYPAGNTVVGTGTIVATIYAASTLNTKKLDLNAGLGNDYKGLEIAQFSLANDDSGGVGSVSVNILPGIPDREFGDGVHDFLYLPVSGADGKVWLNNNLGANYANVNHASFNPSQQATTSNDFNAYGSLFQWGRYSDGHEIINWISGTSTDNAEQLSDREQTGRSSVLRPVPPFNDENYIGFADWLDPARNDLWQATAIFPSNDIGLNNPCPRGFRIPSIGELDAERLSWSPLTAPGALNSPLRVPASGARNAAAGSLSGAGNFGYYWSNSISGDNFMQFSSTLTARLETSTRGFSRSVRCIKE